MPEKILKVKLVGLRTAAGLALVLALAAADWLLHDSELVAAILDAGALKAHVGRLGPLGPIAVIGLMVLAILVSPIPSAPIALAAGALYGHTWGTVYVLLGAEIGALAAFGIARLLGHEVLRRWLGERLSLGWLGSQNALMGLVFVSRLLPFVSFDVVSYAAGLTVLSAWRFAVATLAGIVPASFLLAHIAYLVGLCGRARLLARWWPFALYALVAAGVLAVLRPHLPDALRWPVYAYVVVLSAMAAQAVVAWGVAPDRSTASAAIGRRTSPVPASRDGPFPPTSFDAPVSRAARLARAPLRLLGARDERRGRRRAALHGQRRAPRLPRRAAREW